MLSGVEGDRWTVGGPGRECEGGRGVVGGREDAHDDDGEGSEALNDGMACRWPVVVFDVRLWLTGRTVDELVVDVGEWRGNSSMDGSRDCTEDERETEDETEEADDLRRCRVFIAF